MNDIRTYTSWGLGFIAILLSPIVLIFAIPMGLGIGLDIFDLAGETPLTLALSVPVALAVVHHLSTRSRMSQLAAAALPTRMPVAHKPG